MWPAFFFVFCFKKRVCSPSTPKLGSLISAITVWKLDHRIKIEHEINEDSKQGSSLQARHFPPSAAQLCLKLALAPLVPPCSVRSRALLARAHYAPLYSAVRRLVARVRRHQQQRGAHVRARPRGGRNEAGWWSLCCGRLQPDVTSTHTHRCQWIRCAYWHAWDCCRCNRTFFGRAVSLAPQLSRLQRCDTTVGKQVRLQNAICLLTTVFVLYSLQRTHTGQRRLVSASCLRAVALCCLIVVGSSRVCSACAAAGGDANVRRRSSVVRSGRTCSSRSPADRNRSQRSG